MRRFTFAAAATLLAVGIVAAPSQAQAQKTLTAMIHSDLKTIDPIWTTAVISLNHSSMAYDVLFAIDEKLQVKPQVVERWSVSDDEKMWTFSLRDGLAWHDGQPVTAEDCIASPKRWGSRDTMVQKLVGPVAEWKAIAEAVQVRQVDVPTHIHLGRFVQSARTSPAHLSRHRS